MNFTQGWWDNLTRFWDSVIEVRYGNNYFEHRYTTPEVDYYDGIDAVVITLGGVFVTEVNLQLKASKSSQIKGLKANLLQKNQNGYLAGFGRYFDSDTRCQIDEFVFGYPFAGITIFITWQGMLTIWNWVKENEAEFVRFGEMENVYYSVPIRKMLEQIDKSEYVLVKTKVLRLSDVFV